MLAADVLNERRRLRFALGMTVSIALAMGIDWKLSYIAPLLTASLLNSPSPPLTLKTGLAVLLTMALSFAAGLVLSAIMVRFPLTGSLLLALGLFRVFFWNNSGEASPFLVMFLLISITLLPMMALVSEELALTVVDGFLWSGAAAIAISWIMQGILPDPPGTQYQAASAQGAAESAAARFSSAVASTLVVLPLAFLLFSFNLASYALVLVFVVLLAQQPDLATGVRAGLALVIGNSLGGGVALVVYALLLAWPSYPFMLSLMLLTALLLSARIFSADPYAKLYAMGFSTVVLLICSVTSSSGGEVDAKFYTRIMQLIMVTIYLTLALTAVSSLLKPGFAKGAAQQSEHPTA